MRYLAKATTLILTILLLKTNAYSASYISYNLKSKEIISSKNELAKIYPASLTKIMTVYLVIDAIKNGQFSLYDKVRVPVEAANQPKTNANLKTGQSITIKDLIMLTSGISANDAAYTLGYHVGGENIDSFIEMMNKKAGDLGLQNTHFANPTGLHNPDQYSNAMDIVKLMESFVKNHAGYLGMINSNDFILNYQKYTSRNQIARNYKCIKAHKTGFTGASGYNIVGYLNCGNHEIISAAIGFNNSQERNTSFASNLNYATAKITESDQDFYTTREDIAEQNSLALNVLKLNFGVLFYNSKFQKLYSIVNNSVATQFTEQAKILDSYFYPNIKNT